MVINGRLFAINGWLLLFRLTFILLNCQGVIAYAFAPWPVRNYETVCKEELLLNLRVGDVRSNLVQSECLSWVGVATFTVALWVTAIDVDAQVSNTIR